ncbi:hypothetical protein EDC04DRAFT_2617151 [Pisolithus marmoratus]|nr:hypothetical protein EDC04DRAFT_2617151 [Pisolithus marmoratus]
MLSISELLATLRSITSLQELKLHNVLKAVNENLLVEWVMPTTVLPALQTLDLQVGIQFCSGFLNGVEALALVELDVECSTTDKAGDAPLLTSTMLMIGISGIVPHDPYNIFTVLHQKGNLWILLHSNQTGAFCQILVLQATHRKVMGEMWVYLFKHLNKVSCLDLGNYPVPHILKNLYWNVKGALEVQKQGEEVILLLPSLETITIAMSLMLCILVDMIAELHESKNGYISGCTGAHHGVTGGKLHSSGGQRQECWGV